MARQITLLAYHPWWFRLYVVAVNTFAYLAGLDVDTDKLEAQARKATRYREIDSGEEGTL
ncbi:hypothetical protein [Pseudomonas extremaustralis]|uniref:hypothetical protein n=1 Tax=Pseudomonas extremaustralis TaxID=359110 RepID=UPI002862999A|nr:hypothetical protein [Pseudomonas extremaustralis]MDR6579988.1 hypothetical protein [Pseudomonas extremaustralis]